MPRPAAAAWAWSSRWRPSGKGGCSVRARRCCSSSTSSSSGSIAQRGEENTELVAALRQCDGEHVQAVVLVRDDFWMAATRFMGELEVDLVQDAEHRRRRSLRPRHARKVLTAFGRAYGTLPERDRRPDPGPAGVPRSGDRRAGPGRQGHLGAAGPVRRDGQGEALDPGDLAGGRRHRGRRRRPSSRRPSAHRRPTPSTASTRRRPRPS